MGTITLYCIILYYAYAGPQILRDAGALLFGTGAWLTSRKMPSPRVTTPNLVVLGQTVRAFVRRSAGKWAPRVPPLKVTGTDTGRYNL